MFRIKNIENIKVGDIIKHPVYYCYNNYKNLLFIIKNEYVVCTVRYGNNICSFHRTYHITYIVNNTINIYVLQPKQKIRVLM